MADCKFYYGQDGLAEMSDLPAGITAVTPANLLVKSCGVVVISSPAANSVLVAQADPAVDFAEWGDLTGGLDQAAGVTALGVIQ